jgi:catechol 2,3-dioxygenase-like lactoylglutathione lyase family enzyme
MLDHVSVQVSDVNAAAALYSRLFAPLGISELMRFPRGPSFAIGLGGADGFPHFWLGPTETTANRELHIAFTATDRGQVDAVHDIAVTEGVEVLHPPRVWPEYHPSYYAVFLRDLDGNNVEAVCHRPG